jgi:hypothetical protein
MTLTTLTFISIISLPLGILIFGICLAVAAVEVDDAVED